MPRRSPPEYRQEVRAGRRDRHICYRRFGHNEGDDRCSPNPAMYERIRKQKTTLSLYGPERLVQDGLITEGGIGDMKAAFPGPSSIYEFEPGKTYKPQQGRLGSTAAGRNHRPRGASSIQRGQTAISEETMARSAGRSPPHPST